MQQFLLSSLRNKQWGIDCGEKEEFGGKKN
jgi:hypothetical protein